jgi:imidazolonepropionase-like amidohydrolase
MIRKFTNALIFDGTSPDYIEGDVLVENDIIREVAGRIDGFDDAETVNCGGRILMPGLIDAHFHAYTPTFNLQMNDHMPKALMTAHATKILEGSLQRGFTTVRDAAGGDIGLRMAIDQGLIKGPRFFFPGKALSQTGGHGDPRPGDQQSICGCAGYSGAISMVADGADAVRLAVREELRKGATHIKLMLSGGVVSPTDPMWMPQFTDEEVLAAVYEASTRRTYVMAHVHTDDAAKRCAKLGIRTVEHGTDIRADTAKLLAATNTFVVPTLSVGHILAEHGARIGIPPMGLEKIKGVADVTARSIENCLGAGVRLGLGADLLGHEFHPYQGGELALRGEFQKPIEVLRSATSINAEIVQMTGKLGCIAEGAFADMLVLDGDPLEDLSLFKDSKNIPLITRGGEMVRNLL